MTIWLDQGNYWIDFVQGPLVNVVNGGDYGQVITLVRAGRFAGGSVWISDFSVNTFITGVGLRNTAFNNINYGEEISQIRIEARNQAGVAQDITMQALIFLKK